MDNQNKRKKETKYDRIYFFTHSNLDNIAFGDSNNDSKFFSALPNDVPLIKIYPSGKFKKIEAIFRAAFKILKNSFIPKQFFTSRGVRPLYIPTLFKKLFNHKIIVYLGCTPFIFIERAAFNENQEYANQKDSIFIKIFFKFEHLFEKFVVRNANVVIIENNRSKRIVEKFGGSSMNIITAPYYVQDYFLKGKNPSYNSKIEPFIIGYTGRFHKYDKLEPVIKAIADLKKKGLNIQFQLIGDGITKKQMENLVKKLELEREIIFLGSKPHQEVAKLLDNFHCLLLPMVDHLCPSTIAIKILEGVLGGKIIITNNAGNNKSLFEPYSDLILENFESKQEIANTIQKVLENYQFYNENALKIRDIQIKIHNKQNFQSQIMDATSNIFDK